MAQTWLKSISSATEVDVCETFSTAENLENVDLFILTEVIAESRIEEINTYCRDNNKGFIYAVTLGLFCSVFVDFGNAYKLHDRDGEDTYPFLIASISKANPGVVYLVDQQTHNFQTGKRSISYRIHPPSLNTPRTTR